MAPTTYFEVPFADITDGLESAFGDEFTIYPLRLLVNVILSLLVIRYRESGKMKDEAFVNSLPARSEQRRMVLCRPVLNVVAPPMPSNGPSIGCGRRLCGPRQRLTFALVSSSRMEPTALWGLL